ncbi:hypothetical protein RHGRI_035641 [Rhododendron griersonianum]|uniref:Uncharacterized protein n=1 Tax=Rhododendron griersonianum TaxID=479676 RepID=A0AAV6HQ83_9ERIC|nr:hypothetical protein RHGRI_035641 [Rhododendron griersonianum]
MLCKRVALVLLTKARASCDLPQTLLRSSIPNSVKSFSSKRVKADEQSFTVSYLISSCGLSPQTALSASQKVNFRSAEQPDSVLALLRNHGFTAAHISRLARRCPQVLSSDPKNTLLPKLEFFESIGIPSTDLANSFSGYPTLLKCSLTDQIIPVYNYLKTVILLNDKQVRKSFRYSPRLFGTNLEKNIRPRIATLRELNVPASALSVLVTYNASVLLQNSKKFDKTVKEAVEISPKPLNGTFVQLLKMMLGLSNSTWEHKMEVFRKCGWSEDDLQLALKKFPFCMSVSEKKIMSAMDFLVNEMGWKPAAIAKVPSVLLFSVKRRTIPRCSVLKVLILKGLISKDVCLSTVLMRNDKYFLDRFVTKYAQDVPQLLDIFNGKVSLAELGLETEETCGRKTIVASRLH